MPIHLTIMNGYEFGATAIINVLSGPRVLFSIIHICFAVAAQFFRSFTES